MKNKKIKLLAIILGGCLVLTGFGCKETITGNKKTTTGDKNSTGEKIELNWWRLWDSQDVFEPQIKAYEKDHPNVKINYRKLTYQEYEKEITSALAAGKGPDIWTIHNTWLPKHIEKLAPIPAEVMTSDTFGEVFVDVAKYDLQDSSGNLYGIPLSVDTLALYYNKDFFNTAGLTSPPRNWTEFKEDVKKLTKVDSFGNIELAGAAIGTSKNVARAVDILYLLMLQNGTQMTDDKNAKATFNNKAKANGNEVYTPGLDALIFYTDFASPKKSIYTWNPTLHNSVDSFIEEKTAMMLSYSYQNVVIKSKAPKLNYDIATIPQIEGSSKEVNFANYWAEVVSATSSHQKESWDFLAYLTQKENIESYTKETERPASRKDVIETQLQDPNLKIFAKQALTARSWYQVDSSAIEGIFSNLIESVALGEKDSEQGINESVEQVSSLMTSKKK